MKDLYLKPNIKAEPLIWNWYAWGYLIPPIAAGCSIVERHLQIMIMAYSHKVLIENFDFLTQSGK